MAALQTYQGFEDGSQVRILRLLAVPSILNKKRPRTLWVTPSSLEAAKVV
jgi:hypothetical protein